MRSSFRQCLSLLFLAAAVGCSGDRKQPDPIPPIEPLDPFPAPASGGIVGTTGMLAENGTAQVPLDAVGAGGTAGTTGTGAPTSSTTGGLRLAGNPHGSGGTAGTGAELGVSTSAGGMSAGGRPGNSSTTRGSFH
jgi:hypothetical protein